MKVFGDLEVELNDVPFNDLIARLDAAKSPAWKRNSEFEERLGRRGMGNGRCYTYTGPDFPSANLWLFGKGSGAQVSNIVPKLSGQLSIEEYNGILTHFHDDLLGPAAEEMGLRVRLSKTGVVTIADYVSEVTAEKLRRFSESANKSTGSSHPMDNERWNDFVIANHRNRDYLPTDILKLWLVEDGWDADTAYDLTIEYEQGISLLRRYDGID